MEDSEEPFRPNTVGRVRRNMQERDLAVAVNDDIGAELQRVIARRPPDALAGDERPQARRHHTRAQEPQRCRTTCPERVAEHALRVGDDEGTPERKLITPDRGSSGTLGCDDDQPGACRLDLGHGLHDTAKV